MAIDPAIAQALAQQFTMPGTPPQDENGGMSTEAAQAAAKDHLEGRQDQEAAQDPIPPPPGQGNTHFVYPHTSADDKPFDQTDLENAKAGRNVWLEDKLRYEQQLVQQLGDNQFLQQPGDIGQDAMNSTGAQRLIANADQAGKNIKDRVNADAASQNETVLEKENVDKAISNDSQAVQDKLTAEIQARHDHLLAVQADVEKQQAEAISNYKVVVQNMNDMAVAQPKDIYDAAGMNGVLGRIAVFLGGAGVNGNHQNNALEYVSAMADRTIQQQKMKFDMMSKVGEGDRTLYGMLNAKLANAYQVDSTIKNMALETYKSQLLSVANKYSNQTIHVQARAEADKISAEQTKLLAGVQNDIVSNIAKAGDIAAKEHATAVKAIGMQQKQLGALRTTLGVPMEGFVGGVPAAEHPRLAKMVGGARDLVKGVDHMQKWLAENPNASMAMARKYFVNDAILFKAARDFLETGTRIEAGEQKVLDRLTSNDKEALFALTFGKIGQIGGLSAKLQAIKQDVTSSTYQAVKAAGADGVEMDSRDPLFGPYNPRNFKEGAMDQAFADTKAYIATGRGRGLIKGSPEYNAEMEGAQQPGADTARTDRQGLPEMPE